MRFLKHAHGGAMRPKGTIIVAICLVVVGGCATSQPGQRLTEHLNFTFPWKPKLGHEAEGPAGYSIHEFTREEDDINHWEELVTVQSFSKSWGGASPEEALNSLKEIRERRCPGQTKWNVISKGQNSILYEWQARSCLDAPDQHEIAKILDGQYNRFRLAFTAKTYQLSPDRRGEWIDIIAKSKVVKD